jgi:hypothetical protein
LSPTFADNVGADDLVVHNGPITLSTANTGPDLGPRDFDIIITLINPFLYDPAAGNLLIDFRSTGQLFPFDIRNPTPVDAENRFGDSVSVVLGRSGNLNAPNGETTTVGFVTRFSLIPSTPPPVGPPTSKEACMNGGWRSFDTPRTFKNQGDCIQFVNTGK